MRSRLGMFAYYQKRRVGGRTSHLARGDRVPIHLLTYLLYTSRSSPYGTVGGPTVPNAKWKRVWPPSGSAQRQPLTR